MDNLNFYPERGEEIAPVVAPAPAGWIDRIRGWANTYRIELILFFLLWITYAYFYQSTQHNEACRLDQTRAIIQDRTLAINKYWWNTADVIHYDKNGTDHIYPAKAPGMSFIGIPPYAFFLAFLKIFTALGMPEYVYWHLVTYLTVVFSVSLFSALAGVTTFRILKTSTNDEYFSAFVVIGIWLGTLCFPFSTIYFSHQMVAALLALAFYLIFPLRRRDVIADRRTIWSAGLAGFLMGFSVATEYPTAVLDSVLSLYFLWLAWRWQLPTKDKVRIVGSWIAGGAIGGLILLTYNLLAFGKPFYLAYEALTKPGSPFPTHTHGLVGFALPDWNHFVHAVASFMIFPPVGLLYLKIENWRVYACNPVLWFVLPGLVVMFWKREWRAEAFLIFGLTLAYLVFIASYGTSIYDWAGATYLGPRHIIPLLSFLALPLYFGARRWRPVFYALLAICAFYMLLATAIEPRMPTPFEVPARDFLIPDFLRARFAENTFNMFDPQNHNLTKDSTAFNWAKLAGVPGRYQLLPLMLWWLVAGGAIIFLAARPPAGNLRRKWSPRFVTAGLVLFTGAIAAAPIVHHAAMSSRDVRRGLLGKYYRNANWIGEPIETQVDEQIDFDWSKSFPLPAPFSVEWTGNILIEPGGVYTFWIIADDGAILDIDHQVIIDASKDVLQEKTGAITLEAGMHPIRVRYINNLFGGSVRLSWSLVGRPKEIVPSNVLFPDKPANAK